MTKRNVILVSVQAAMPEVERLERVYKLPCNLNMRSRSRAYSDRTIPVLEKCAKEGEGWTCHGPEVRV